jgi:hypothetical protein
MSRVVFHEGFNPERLKDIDFWAGLSKFGNGTAVYLPLALDQMRSDASQNVISAKSVFDTATRNTASAPRIDKEGITLIKYLRGVLGEVSIVPTVYRRHTLLFSVTDEQLGVLKRAARPELFTLHHAHNNASVHANVVRQIAGPLVPNTCIVGCPAHMNEESMSKILVDHLSCDTDTVSCERVRSGLCENPPNAMSFFFYHKNPQAVVDRTIVFGTVHQARLLPRANVTYWSARHNVQPEHGAAVAPHNTIVPWRAVPTGPTFSPWNKRSATEVGLNNDDDGGTRSRGSAAHPNGSDGSTI